MHLFGRHKTTKIIIPAGHKGCFYCTSPCSLVQKGHLITFPLYRLDCAQLLFFSFFAWPTV
uniref:Uncharacterized protein n=1 Tax=Anguilla anguilla TaxID=7936 RepID=A0A0E9U496_ANGAN